VTTTVEQPSGNPQAPQRPGGAAPTPPGLRERVSAFLMSHVRQSGMVVALVAIVALFQIWTSGILLKPSAIKGLNARSAEAFVRFRKLSE